MTKIETRILGFGVLALGAGCRVSPPAVVPRIEPPPGAAIAGLTRRIFAEEFETDAGIDLQDTREAGFSFYLARPFGWPPTGADAITVQDGVLTIRNPVNRAQLDLVSAVPAGEGEWTGFAPRGPLYFEAAIAFDPADFDPAPKTGFPAFWTMSAEHLFDSLWVRTKARYEYLEIDFMEWNPSWHAPDAYLQAIHAWTNDRDVEDRGLRNRRVTFPRPFDGPGGKVIRPADAVDWREFNTFGVLWIPGDRIDTYFNDRLVRSVSVAEHPEIGFGDDHHFPVILGSGNFPMRVDWVRVWAPQDCTPVTSHR